MWTLDYSAKAHSSFSTICFLFLFCFYISLWHRDIIDQFTLTVNSILSVTGKPILLLQRGGAVSSKLAPSWAGRLLLFYPPEMYFFTPKKSFSQTRSESDGIFLCSSVSVSVIFLLPFSRWWRVLIFSHFLVWRWPAPGPYHDQIKYHLGKQKHRTNRLIISYFLRLSFPSELCIFR